MKIQYIIDRLCAHEMTKKDAITEISKIVDGLRKQNALEFTVDGISSTVENHHGYLKLKLPYGFSDMEGKFEKGDKVDVIVIP